VILGFQPLNFRGVLGLFVAINLKKTIENRYSEVEISGKYPYHINLAKR